MFSSVFFRGGLLHSLCPLITLNLASAVFTKVNTALACRNADPLDFGMLVAFFPPLHFLADCKTGLGDIDGSPFTQRTFRRLHSFLFTRLQPSSASLP